jgi:hypothetical protein
MGGWAPGCCSGSLPSRIREAGINGLLPATRVPSIYSVSPLRVLDCRLPEQREVTVICVRKILVVVILKAREPARIMVAIGAEDRWHLELARALDRAI